MAEYINRNALLESIRSGEGTNEHKIFAALCVSNAPAADVVPRSEVVKLEQDVARLEQEKDELVRKIFEELGDYAADFVAGHIDDDNFLRAIYNLKAKYTNPVQCKDCKYLMFSDIYGECSKGYRGIVSPEDSCEHGEKKI